MKTAQLVYSIICDDVRIEMGNKLSLMGLFENIFFQAFPSALLKFAIVNHWHHHCEQIWTRSHEPVARVMIELKIELNLGMFFVESSRHVDRRNASVVLEPVVLQLNII